MKNEGAYRTAIVPFKQISKENVFRYVLADRWISSCVFCSTSVYYSEQLICTPFNRVTIKGMWWWKKLCPVQSVHKHFVCSKCRAVFLLEMPQHKIIEVVQ